MSLRERRDVVALFQEARTSGHGKAVGGVLFTVVGVTGSSYRRPGAHMLALDDGRTAGTLSGGCLEADLLRRAAWTVRNGAAVEHFSTAFDDTSEVPYGLGCGGEIDILAERLGTPEADALFTALDASLGGQARLITTVLPDRKHLQTQTLARAVFDNNNQPLFATASLATGPLAHVLHSRADTNLGHDLCGTKITPLCDIYQEYCAAAQRLVIFGAGEDAKPLVRLGAEMGFSVLVVDSRPQHAKPERFPQAGGVVLARSALEVPVRSTDVAILMTHSYDQDRGLLAELLPITPRYLGLLGARHRSALLLGESAALAGVSLEDAVERTHAPIGLELGGDGPEAVALAIIAEVQHTLSSKQPLALNRRLTLAQAEQLLADGSPVAYGGDACALYSEVGAT